MKILAAILLTFWTPFVLAQAGLTQGVEDPSKADIKALNANGRWIHIEIAPEDKVLRYYVFGNKEGEINWGDLKLFKTQMNPISAPNPQEAPSKPEGQKESKKHKISVIAPALFKKALPAKVKVTVATAKASGASDFSYLIPVLILLLIALYAYRASSKNRRQSAVY